VLHLADVADHRPAEHQRLLTLKLEPGKLHKAHAREAQPTRNMQAM
jgi:hypothetical protein